MKIWGIIATIFLVASLCLNVWFYTETTNLNTSIRQQNENLDLELELEGDSKYQLPFETMHKLRSNIGILTYSILEYRMYAFQVVEENDRLEDENWELEHENEQLRATLVQIQEEAERAQEYEMWEQLLQLIWLSSL